MLDRLGWVQRSLLVGALLLVGWTLWPGGGMRWRVLRDVLIYLVGPLALGITHGRHIGWRIDRGAIRNAVVLAAFVLPFYVVGSTLPTIRAYYPMWGVTPTLGSFVPHAITLLVLALAAETYYRGLLCVGVREIGFKCVFISPIVYALVHVGKPPIEVALSGPTDVLFGAVDYHADSILPSTVAHGGGLILLDWLVLHEPVISPELVVRALSWLPIPV